MVILLVVVAIVVGVIGGLMLTQATLGVGIICAGCLIGILARIAQASGQHEEVIQLARTSNSRAA